MESIAVSGMSLDAVSVRLNSHAGEVRYREGLASIACEIVVDTDESERRLELLHENVRKDGTVFNTVMPGTHLSGVLRRRTALPE
jgi:hypothetical protein